MSGVELLGFACNIMQVISFSREVISLCSNVYQGKHPDANLPELANSLQAVSLDVQTRFDNMQPKTADERRLCDIATRCAIAARDLEEEVSFIISRQKQGSLGSTLQITAKTTWRKRRLDRLEKSLQEHERVLDSHLMARVCKQTDAIELKQREGFEKLGADIQYFVSQYAVGHKKVNELVRSDIQVYQRASEKAMKAHVTEEVMRSQAAVFSHIDSQAELSTQEATRRLRNINIRTKDDSACKGFLQSLKYPAMNERRNHLTDSHEGTFKWVFHEHQHSNDVNNDVSDECSHPEYKDNGMTAPQCQPWDDFEDWLKSDSNIYWISGKPGSGKSTLMKFLISNPLTKEALRTWSSNAVIISHFFWKPGSMAQKNVKGLFASLLHQLLTIRGMFLRTLLASSRDFQQKDSDTDWSTIELRSLCLNTMKSYPSSICVFLDGLDEICDEDGVHVLMEIVDTFKTIPGVKICVSSRPEQRFKLYLSQIPQLKVHDLTSGDISRYAAQTLSPFWKRRQDISNLLIDKKILPELLLKAQGVFLWIKLAVKNLIAGLESGDTGAEIVLRLQDLPSELSQMYADMWTRANGNTKVHRESTAKLLNLIIDYQRSWTWKVREQGHRPVHVIDIMGATDVTIQNELFVWGQEPATAAAMDSCIRARELIELRCIGLVEIGRPERTYHPIRCDASLRPHALPTIDFIHRTAYDYLTDTEEGRQILSHDSSSEEVRLSRLFRGLLVALVVTQESHTLGNILAKLAQESHSVTQEMTDNLLKICWRLYSRNLIERTPLNMSGLKQHFLAFIILPEFGRVLAESINRSPQSSVLATEVLRDVVFSRMVRSSSLPQLGLLVSLGADPILKGLVYDRNINRLTKLDHVPFTESLSVLQGVIRQYCVSHTFDKEPITNTFLQELMKFCWDRKAALAEPLCMSIFLDRDEWDLYPGAPEPSFKLRPKPSQGAQTAIYIETSLQAQILVEAQAAFWVEVLQRRHKAWSKEDEWPAPLTLLKEQIQDQSSIRICYFWFKQWAVEIGAEIVACYRVQDQESIKHIERPIKSWLLGETGAYPGQDLYNAITRAQDDAVAGSSTYERVYGDIKEHLADEGLSYCRVYKKEIEQRGQHMREEDPDVPGHWL